MIANLLTQPGVLIIRNQTGSEDEYGTPTWTTDEVSVMCHVQPRTSQELVEAAGAGITGWRGWFPPFSLIEPADALLLDDGRQFEFVGPPRPWVNPSLNVEQHVEADLQRVEREAEESS